MSTYINISDGGSNLVNQVKVLQQAARQGQLEKENRSTLEREATQERTAALATEGRDATGAPTSGNLPRPALVRDEPIAQRIESGSGFLLVPTNDYDTYRFTAKTRGIKNQNYVNRLYTLAGSFTDEERLHYSMIGGPSNEPYLRPRTIPSLPQGTFNTCRLNHRICDNFNVIGSVLEDSTLVYTANGPEAPVAIKKVLHELKKWTFEAYVLTPPEGPISPGIGSVEARVGAYVDVSTAGLCNFSLAFIDQGSSLNTFTLTFSTADFLMSVIFDPLSTDQPSDYKVIWPYTLNFGTWYHVAMLRNDTIYTLYFNGSLVTQFNITNGYFDVPRPFSRTTAVVETFNGGATILNPGIHGLRFTSKALYSGPSFTPPSKITSLA